MQVIHAVQRSLYGHSFSVSTEKKDTSKTSPRKATCLFERGSCIAQACLKIAVWPRMPLNV